jgi:hypothetical protein
MDSKEKILLSLENLLLDDTLEDIENRLNEFNILSILKIDHLENIHSNFLSWILNPRSNHGLQDYPLKKFLKNVFRNHLIYEKQKISIIDLDIWNMNEIEVLREWNRIDISLIDDKNRFVCIIENKLYSSESETQLQKYKQIIETKYPEYSKIFLFLTIDGTPPTDDDYLVITYDEIVQLLKSILESKGGSMTNEVRYLIENFYKSMKGRLLDESELKKQSQQIYKEHKEALDYIFDNKPDDQLLVKNELIEWIKTEPNWNLDDSSKRLIRFIPKQLDSIIPKKGEGWTKSKRMLLFELQNEKKPELNLMLYIGPGPQPIRESLYMHAKEYSRIFPETRKEFKTKKWFNLYRKTIIKESDFKDLTDEEIIDLIESKHDHIRVIVAEITDAFLKYTFNDR